MLTSDKAKEIIGKHITEEHLIKHCVAVSAAMGAMARHFGADEEYWRAIGYLHDVDYEQYPEEHLQHTEEMLAPEGISADDIRAVLSHGWGLCSDVEPKSDMEKSLFTVDELTGIIMAGALMRPTGIEGLETKSIVKKFKDKRFAAKCDRAVIQQGCDMLGMPLADVIGICIEGMQGEAEALGLTAKDRA